MVEKNGVSTSLNTVKCYSDKLVLQMIEEGTRGIVFEECPDPSILWTCSK